MRSPSEPNILGVIFDVDGTLVNSNRAHAQAWTEALHEHGIAADEDRLFDLVGMGSDHLLPEVAGIEKNSPRGKQIAERRGDLFKTHYLPGLKPFPGARALVEKMKAEGMKVVVASSADKDELDPLLDIAGVKDLFEAVTAADDAERSKPDPDIVQAALAQLDLPPDQAVMIGDTQYDIEAARKAGVRLIALRSGGRTDSQLAGAAAIYDDIADVLRHYDEAINLPVRRTN